MRHHTLLAGEKGGARGVAYDMAKTRGINHVHPIGYAGKFGQQMIAKGGKGLCLWSAASR